MRLRSARAGALVAVLSAVLLGACGSPADPAGSPSPTASPTPSVSPTAPAPPPRPVRDACHRLSYEQAVAPVVSGTDVRCGDRHTSQTYAVGRLDLLQDGHLLAVDSPGVQAQVARACTDRLGAHVGGTAQDLRLSMVLPVWFTPSVDEAGLGANWYRCDVVVLARPGRLLPLPTSSRGLLDSSRFAMCGTAEPGHRGFARVPCGVGRHSWAAASSVDLPGDAYPSAARAAELMKGACRAAARSRAEDPLDLTWSEERPSRAQWAAGRRYGICWVPA